MTVYSRDTQALFDATKRISARDAADRAGIHLVQRGNRAWAKCIFHADDTESLVFYPDGRYYCFGCKASGDAAMLYQQHYGLDPAGAAKRLLSDFGLAEPSADDVKAMPIKPRVTASDLKETVETVRERRIDELLTIKRKALKQIGIIEQNTDLSEGDRMGVMQLQAAAGAADHQIAMIESLEPGDLVAWVAGGASIDAI